MIKCYTRTLTPVGADGSAVDTDGNFINHAGFLRAVAVDYQNQPATTDILIKDGDTNGATLFTRTSSNTDLAATVVTPENAVTEDGSAATGNAGFGGVPFTRGLFIDVAQGDGQTSGDEKIVIKLWVER